MDMRLMRCAYAHARAQMLRELVLHEAQGYSLHIDRLGRTPNERVRDAGYSLPAEYAIEGNQVESVAVAKGLGQVMPMTWNEWAPQVGASDPFDARDNLRVACAYLGWLLRRTGSEWRALYAYVWGIGYLESGAEIPAEVVQYAAKIIHGRDLLRAVLGG